MISKFKVGENVYFLYKPYYMMIHDILSLKVRTGKITKIELGNKHIYYTIDGNRYKEDEIYKEKKELVKSYAEDLKDLVKYHKDQIKKTEKR